MQHMCWYIRKQATKPTHNTPSGSTPTHPHQPPTHQSSVSTQIPPHLKYSHRPEYPPTHDILSLKYPPHLKYSHSNTCRYTFSHTCQCIHRAAYLKRPKPPKRGCQPAHHCTPFQLGISIIIHVTLYTGIRGDAAQGARCWDALWCGRQRVCGHVYVYVVCGY